MRGRKAEFERKLAQTGLWQLLDLLQTLPDETARLAGLCYAASPASDWLDTPPEVFFSCAAHARYLRENVSWTRALPEPLFLAYVLHPRVNNEALCDCRPVFYAALADAAARSSGGGRHSGDQPLVRGACGLSADGRAHAQRAGRAPRRASAAAVKSPCLR